MMGNKAGLVSSGSCCFGVGICLSVANYIGILGT